MVVEAYTQLALLYFQSDKAHNICLLTFDVTFEKLFVVKKVTVLSNQIAFLITDVTMPLDC